MQTIAEEVDDVSTSGSVGRGQRFSYVYILLAILFQAFSGILSKYASMSIQGFTAIALLSNVFYFASLTCLVLQALVWQQALRYYELSFAYAFLSLVNFIVLMSSYLLFNESITLANVMGLVIISCGIYLISKRG